MSKNPVDVVIVGAGPVGLTMAAILTNLGLTYRIVEKSPAPTDKSKALVVWSRTLELLDKLGLADVFVKTGRKVRWGNIYGGGEHLVHLELSGADSPFDYPLMIPQNETERLLREHLEQQGTTIERNVELVSFVEHPDKIVVLLRQPDGTEEVVESSWLIGCDGAHSAVRHILGVEFTGSAEQNDWMLADIEVDGALPADAVTVFWHQSGILIFFPITETRFRVIADLGASTIGGLRPDPTLAEIQAKVDERGPGGITLKNPVWLSNFRINERKVSDYYRGRVMLAGDAAHIHSPAGGQGMNTGMQDAFNLGWKLALIQRGTGQRKPLLDSYTIERSAVGDQVLKGAQMVTTIGTLRNPVAQFFRNHVASVMTSFQFVRDRVRNAASELAINYRHSPLSTHTGKKLSAAIHVGDRVPDLPLIDETGAASTIFALTRHLQFTLLLFPGSQQSVAQLAELATRTMKDFPNLISTRIIVTSRENLSGPLSSSTEIHVWQDESDALRRRLGVSDSAAVIIRPDGYVGHSSQPVDEKALAQLLNSYLIATPTV